VQPALGFSMPAPTGLAYVPDDPAIRSFGYECGAHFVVASVTIGGADAALLARVLDGARRY
jgi:hypothetical protein